MLIKSNLHTHTVFSDGRDSAEAMVLAALAKGFCALGFSDHGHADYDDCSMPTEAEADYRAEILRLKAKYAGQIEILLGYERDWLSGADIAPYDYAIESIHYLKAGGEYVCVDNTRAILEDAIRRHYGGDAYALCRDYFREVAASCAGGAQILGHMELVMKFNERRDLFDDADPRYLGPALEAAECAARSGMLIEVNTGAIARGYRREPYPGAAILRRLAELNARIVIASDCHDARQIDCAFDEVAALARACGFRDAWVWRGGRLEECPL